MTMPKTSKQKWLLLPVLCWFVSWPFVKLDPAENLTLGLREQALLTQLPFGLFYQDLPQQPLAAQALVSFKDQELQDIKNTILPNQALDIQSLIYREDGTPLFALKDGSYILASRSLVYDNQVLTAETLDQSFFIKPGAQFYKEFPTAQAKPASVPYKPYQQVRIVQKLTYPRGPFGLTDKGEYVAWSSLSKEDNRIQRVQELLEQKYQEEGLGIYVKQLETQQVAGVKFDQTMYSASITKLPYLYYVQKQVLDGTLKWTDTFFYKKETEDYDGAYDPAGTGSLPKEPDGKNYSLKELEEKAAKESDNVAHNILGYYGTDSSNQDFHQEIRQIVGQTWDVVDREVSPQMAGLLMEAIYGQQGELVEMLKQTNFDDQRIPKDLPVPVAHKIGDADDFHHDAAIVFAKSPYVLVVFTENKEMDLIARISKDIYEVLK